MAELSAAARLRKAEDELQKAVQKAQREREAVKKASATERTRLTNAEQIEVVKRDLEQAEQRARLSGSDQDLGRVIGLRQQLKSLTPQHEEEPEKQQERSSPRLLCPRDGLPPNHNGVCPACGIAPREYGPAADRFAELKGWEQVNRPAFWER
jgi:hypothetical protein